MPAHKDLTTARWAACSIVNVKLQQHKICSRGAGDREGVSKKQERLWRTGMISHVLLSVECSKIAHFLWFKLA